MNLSQISKDIPFPACSQFEPIILRGQLCYSLDVAKHTNLTTRSGKNHGLLLIVDPTVFLPQDIDLDVNIHFNTLEGATGKGGGRYYLSALKRMTATESFLKIADQSKGCRAEDYQKCQERQYRLAVEKQCGCVPWTLAGVPWKGSHESSYCLLDKYNCTANITDDSLDCGLSCTGLYSDMNHGSDFETDNFLPLEEYKRYRDNFVKNIMFDPDKEELSKF